MSSQRPTPGTVLQGALCGCARQALLDLQPDEHNRLIAEAAAKQQACDVIALAQFSMAPAKTLAATRTKTPILTTPDSAVAKLKVLLA